MEERERGRCNYIIISKNKKLSFKKESEEIGTIREEFTEIFLVNQYPTIFFEEEQNHEKSWS